MFCFGLIVFMYCEPPKQVVADSYCSAYIKIIQAKGDGAIQATSNVKRRILANERTYQKACRG